jgi:hypothetical protein
MDLEYEGYFEVHITLENTENITNISNGYSELKVINIDFSNNSIQNHLMTSSKYKGTLSKVKNIINSLVNKLNKDNIKVYRVKIEASPFNNDIPYLEDRSIENYFETHIKVKIENKNEVLKLCKENDVHLSRNSFKNLDNGKFEYFLTLRKYGMGLKDFLENVNNFTKLLKKNNIHILETIVEYCVYDSNVDMDNEWINSIL